MNAKNTYTEPLNCLSKTMSVKYTKDSSTYLINNNELSKERNSQGNYYNKKTYTSLKGLAQEKSFKDTVTTISSGPLMIPRGLDNRNSGGSSSVATPNSPQQSPLSLGSSSGENSSTNQGYEGGLSEEELRQIALRQQSQIQSQIENLREKQHKITHLRQHIEKTSKFPKVSQSIMKLKDLYDQQEQKIIILRNSKNQLFQTRKNCAVIKTDLANFQNLMNNKIQELKKLESYNEELRQYIQFFHQRYVSSNKIPPDKEAFTCRQNSPSVNLHKSNASYSADQNKYIFQSRVTDPNMIGHALQGPVLYSDHNSRIHVRHVQTGDNFSSTHTPYNEVSDISALSYQKQNFKSKTTENTVTIRAPPLPAHSHKAISVHASDKNTQQQAIEINVSENPLKDKRPPLPSYSDATLISANNKSAMFLPRPNRNNADTPTSSPPVLRRSSIVGLPYGKVPSRFASRNTINNVYIKKSSQESLERYKKNASEIYKAQLSKFKASSTDDVRLDNNEMVHNNATEAVVEKPEIFSSDEKLPDTQTSNSIKSNSTTQESESISSSCSSLSLSEEVMENQISLIDHCEDPTPVTTAKTIDDTNSLINDVDDFDGLLWDKSIMKALEALTKEPERKILKQGNDNKSGSSNKRKAYFHPHSLLLDAALEAEFDLVKDMSGRVENISEATDEGITALHNAVCSGREDIVKFLLDLGAHVNAGDTDGWTPLHCAASCNNVSMARLLVEYGASLFATSISDSEIPLQKCEADDGVDCETYLFAQQDLLGVINDGKVYSLFHYESENKDELTIHPNQELKILNIEPPNEPGWFYAVDPMCIEKEGLVPKAYVSCYPLTLPQKISKSHQCTATE